MKRSREIFFERETPSDGVARQCEQNNHGIRNCRRGRNVRDQGQLGIYGVMAFVGSQRVQEFEIRMALRARSRDVVLLAIRPGLHLVWIGVMVGVTLLMFVTRLMASLLFGVSAIDLGIVALIACLFPAGHAVRISPAQALRC